MELPITALTTAILALWYLRLTYPVIKTRATESISLGVGNDPQGSLARAVRAHANFAEYIPLALLMMALLEWHGLNATYLYLLGGSLIAGRVLHARGIMRAQLRPRTIGMVLTLIPIALSALMLMVVWLLRAW
jgi:uncharacterized membrane protein YecN with MAPEG domain